MEVPQLCRQEDCLRKDNPDEGDQIRCILCCVWHHIDCVSVSKKEMKAMWTCFKCRQIAKSVNDIQQTLSDMQATQALMLSMLQDMTNKMKMETEMRTKAEAELEKVLTELTELKDANLKLQSQPQPAAKNDANDMAVAVSTPPPPPTVKPNPSLLIGTSLLRNVDSRKLENIEVIAKGGATLAELNVALNALPAEKSYEKVIIIGGSIDIERQSAEDVIEEFQALVTSASLRSSKVVVCTIPPRTDKDLSNAILSVNQEIREMTNRDGTTLVDLDEIFMLRNGSVNKLLLHHDGLHLSNHGVDNLLLACDVKLKVGLDSAFNEIRYGRNRPMLFRGHTHPLSNFYQLQNYFVDGIPFATSEAAYVYRKAIFHSDHRTASAVKGSRTGIHAKRLGDKIITSERWASAKVDAMDDVIRAKIEICAEARDALLASNDRDIIEDTKDKFWGIGHNNDGQNMLGKMWTMYRRKLQTNSLPRQRKWATRSSQPRCYRCGEPGHLLEQCRKTEDVNCWSCGQRGHKQKHCQHATRQDRRRY